MSEIKESRRCPSCHMLPDVEIIPASPMDSEYHHPIYSMKCNCNIVYDVGMREVLEHWNKDVQFRLIQKEIRRDGAV